MRRVAWDRFPLKKFAHSESMQSRDSRAQSANSSKACSKPRAFNCAGFYVRCE